ncbi:MAG: ATP-binding protein [Elusimicrobia bacterium]|nr:ATP-binding protein [Elusimicrobiota bacterium]
MTIKNRLIISFASMLIIVVFIAVVLSMRGKILRYYLMQSAQSYSLMAGIREIQYYLDKSVSACDFYFVLGEESEESRFYEFSQMLKEKNDSYLAQLKNYKISKNEYNEYVEIANLCDTLVAKYKNIIAIYASGKKGKAISAVDEDIIPYLNKTRKNIKDIYEEKASDFKVAEKRSLEIEQINFLISSGLSVMAVVLAIILSIMLFRSISSPLSRLREGAERIGNGDFSYEVKLSGNDELTLLAKVFNKMAQNLKKSETQIIQMDRMASLGRLAGGIAHELNNPLTGVLGQSQRILEKLSPTDPLRDTIEKIARAAERCRKITKDLLDFSRQKDYHFEQVSITEVIDTCLGISSSDLTASKINIVKNYGKNMPKVAISTPHIQQVFLNIITNAIQAMPHGGVLTVTTSRDAMVLPTYVNVTFVDMGTGITKENLTKIFTPFFTTKDPGKGTGLGLAISFGIVQRHKGKILISSEGERKGATFTIKLPTGG